MNTKKNEHNELDSVGKKGYRTFQLLRDYTIHEDNLVNYRTTWLLVANGFLFAGCSFTIRGYIRGVE